MLYEVITEYADLARLMVKDEDVAAKPTAIEVYRDEQLKKADLGVPFDSYNFV